LSISHLFIYLLTYFLSAYSTDVWPITKTAHVQKDKNTYEDKRKAGPKEKEGNKLLELI